MAVNLTTPGVAYTQNFDTLAATGASGTLPEGWVLLETGTSAAVNQAYTAGTGSSNAGDIYSYGAAGSTERALGQLLSGTLTPTFGASFTNLTGGTLTGLGLSYTGEMWRLGTLGRADRLDFQYSLDATNLSSGTWLNADLLDFSSPVTTGTVGALDGNASANRTTLSGTIGELTLAPGATFWIRWSDFNASGADDGLAVDDFSLTPIAGPATPTVNLSVSTSAGSETGATVITVTATATSPVNGTQSVGLLVTGAGITAGDYTLSNSIISIPAGATTGSVTLTVVDDALVEGPESMTLTLSAPSSGVQLGAVVSQSVTIADNDVVATLIRDIQGAGHLSPKAGQSVAGVGGIVTAVATNGFYLQDPQPDADPRTSEGIFVFTSSAPTVRQGDAVQVAGTVTEFRAGGSSDNLTVTEIVSPTVQLLSSGNTLPAPVVLGQGGRAIPSQVIYDDAPANVESAGGDFDPQTEGIDFWESLEGMRVQINDPVATSPTARFGTSEELWVLADGGAGATSVTSRGGSLITASDFNPERIQLDDLNNSTVLPTVDVGARLGSVVGIVNYAFSNYEVLLAEAPSVVQASPLQREVTSLVATANQLTVATFNVENLDPGDGAAKFGALAAAIVTNLRAPDIINLEEVQDNNGPTNDSVVSADVTLQTLIAAIAAAGGPTYQYRQIDPVDDSNGGEPGGNIRVAFLFNPARVSFVDNSGGNATTSTTVVNVGGTAALSDSPGLIDPTNAAFAASRKPLVGQFTFNGETVFVIGNHFNSKGGDDPLFGPTQPPVLASEAQRLQQAQVVKGFVQGLLAVDPSAKVIVAGDLNDFEFSNPLNLLEGGGLTSLIETLPANERYSYNFEGNAQTLDHLMASKSLVGVLDGYDVVHINSEFASQVSDHDPVVARFDLPSRQVLRGTSGRDTLTGGDGDDRLIGGAGRDLLAGGLGRDTFEYGSLLDGVDFLADFQPTQDRLDITGLLAVLNYTGSNPVDDGYLSVRTISAQLPIGGPVPLYTVVMIDPDGRGASEVPRPLAVLIGVLVPDAADLLTAPLPG